MKELPRGLGILLILSTMCSCSKEINLREVGERSLVNEGLELNASLVDNWVTIRLVNNSDKEVEIDELNFNKNVFAKYFDQFGNVVDVTNSGENLASGISETIPPTKSAYIKIACYKEKPPIRYVQYRFEGFISYKNRNDSSKLIVYATPLKL